MSSRIKTTVVGSYPIPSWLRSSPSEEAKRDATRVVINIQEKAGLDLVCDGELYRFNINHPETNGMIDYFIEPMSGVHTEMSFAEIKEYEKKKGMSFRTRPPGIVKAKIGAGELNLVQPYNEMKSLATQAVKFTLTGPHMLAKTVANDHYGSVEEIAMAFAEVLAEQVKDIDADVVQIDEANLPGHPEEWEWALAAVNTVLDQVKTKAAVHLCFGNYGGQRVQSGTWDKMIQFFNGLHADHVVLECKRRPADEIEFLKDVKQELGLGVGVIDIKTTAVESPDEIAKDIERIEGIVGEGRVKYIHPDCGFWMLPRSVADAKILALTKGRDLYEGL